MFLPILLRAEKTHFSQLQRWVGAERLELGVMIEAHFGSSGMKPENPQLGNVNCLAI
jgi:hypothetical protein